MDKDKTPPQQAKTTNVKEQQESYIYEERYEIIDGIRYDLQPSPAIDHQILVTELSHGIRTSCSWNGIVVVAPMDVHLGEHTVQPDLIFISNDNAHIVVKRKIMGVPDLLAEIVSPSSGSHDKIRKKALYERFGVKEYWIVDPALHTIDQFIMEGQKLQLYATYGKEDKLISPCFSCIEMNLNAIFAAIERFQDFS